MTSKRNARGDKAIREFPQMKAERAKTADKGEIGDRIRAFRLMRGLNQPQLAAKLGVTKNAVTNWECGSNRPEFGTIAALCRALDISADTFFDLPNRADGLSMEEWEHIRQYRLLSPYEQKSVERLMDAMIENKALAFREECQNNFTRLTRAPLPASAGTGMPLTDIYDKEFVYLRNSRDVCRADEIITASGDSMCPTFADGDDLLVEHTDSIGPGEIGIFVVAGEGFVKEYRPDGLYSHNPKYKPLRPGEDDNVRCIGRVLGVVTDALRASSAEATVLDEIYAQTRRKK